MPNLRNMEERKRLIGSIESEANKARKQWSLRQFEVQSGRIQQYVKEDLEAQFNIDSVKEMPIVSSINVQKRIVEKKASIYKDTPKRTFADVKDKSLEAVELIYKDMKIDSALNKSNKAFIYQDQSIGMIVPQKGKLIMRIFKMHQIDAIPSDLDPESSDGFIVSSFDRSNYIQLYGDKKEKDPATGVEGRSVRSSASEQDGENSEVANEFQYRKYIMKYVVWTPEYNFLMNGHGEILDPETGNASNETDIESPLATEDIMPFFEIAREKDFEFFVRAGNALTDFTVQFNSRLSDEGNNIKMNGYAVGVLKAPSSMQPENIVIGAAMLIKLNTDNDSDGEVDFKFASPNSNIGEISEANDKFLNYFITTEGVGGSAVNSRGDSEKFPSGLDRFIAMVEKVRANKDDYELYRCAETDIYEIIKAYLRVLKGSSQLKSKYQADIPQDSTVAVEYAKPEMIETEGEKLTNTEKKLKLKMIRRVEAIMKDRGIEETAAQEIMEMIDKEVPSFELPNIEVPEIGKDKDENDKEDIEVKAIGTKK